MDDYSTNDVTYEIQETIGSITITHGEGYRSEDEASRYFNQFIYRDVENVRIVKSANN